MRDSIIPSTPLLFTVCRVNIVVRPPLPWTMLKITPWCKTIFINTKLTNGDINNLNQTTTIMKQWQWLCFPTNNQYVILMTIIGFFNGIIREKFLTWMEWCWHYWPIRHNRAMEFFRTSFSNEELVDTVSAFDFAIHIFQLRLFSMHNSCSCIHALAATMHGIPSFIRSGCVRVDTQYAATCCQIEL